MSTLLTIKEACARLRIGRSSFYRLVAVGRIRVVHPVPGRTLVSEKELEAFMASLERRRVA